MTDYLKQLETQFKEAGKRISELPTTVNAADWLNTDPKKPDQLLTDICDVGDKLAIIAPSKLRKSFFLLQLILSLASGRDFLAWHVQDKRRVLLVQLEIQLNHFHRRFKSMASAMGITCADIDDRLHILNARGMGISGAEGITRIGEIAKQFNPEFIGFDPLYKIAEGGENDIEDGKITLSQFDALIKETGAAIGYVHHDTKGNVGDRNIRDRGAGSNILGRDYDACITLTQHEYKTDAIVVETLLRNYPPQESCVISWMKNKTGCSCFELCPDIAPAKKTPKSPIANPKLDTYLPVALDVLKDGPMPIKAFKDLLKAKASLTHKRVDALTSLAVSGSTPTLDTDEKRGKGMHEKMIGTPEQIRLLKAQNG